MEHISRNGKSYEIGKINDIKTNQTYDITTIMFFPSEEEMDKGARVEMVGWYFGDYNYDTTEEYIKLGKIL